MDLAQWPTGTDARVVSVDADAATRLRLSELGVRAGTTVRVTHRSAFGGRVLAVGVDRFALDARTCGFIEVDGSGAASCAVPGCQGDCPLAGAR